MMEPMTVVESDGSVVDFKPEKGCKRVEVSRGVSFAVLVIGFLMCIVAFGTPFWYVEGQQSAGLWNVCDESFFTGNVECVRIIVGRPSQLSFKMRALQTNMTLGLLANGLSFMLYIVWFCKKYRKGTLAFTAVGTHAFAGITQVAAVAIFGAYFSYDLNVLGWSFLVACISGGLQSLTGIITLFVLPFVR